MKIPFGKPLIDDKEKAAVMEVLSGSILVHGPKATEFEQVFSEFTDAPHAVSVSSCTAGMHLIYFSLGYGSGDEVIVPAQTHVATAHAVELTGARAVFVDSELETGNIDISKIEAAITPRTKAITIVHYIGVPVDMLAVMKIAKKHNLFVLEDCALSPGAKIDGIHTGLHGDAGVFSFYPVKHLTSAEGGMIILKDAELASQLKLKKAFGVDRAHDERKVPGVYEVVTLGFNYRMSEIHAAIGIEQVKKLSGFIELRAENHQMLNKHLSRIDGINVTPAPMNRLTSSHYCLVIMLNNILASKRHEIMSELTKQGVGSSIYYPHPVPRLKYYKQKYGYEEENYINAALFSDNSIALPVGPHLNEADMKEIAVTLESVVENLL